MHDLAASQDEMQVEEAIYSNSDVERWQEAMEVNSMQLVDSAVDGVHGVIVTELIGSPKSRRHANRRRSGGKGGERQIQAGRTKRWAELEMRF